MLLVCAIRAGLWLLPFRVMRRIIRKTRRASLKSDARVSVERAAWAVGVVSNYVPSATCLTQALATVVLARRYGQEALLRIGVVRTDVGGLLAHAWVESEGRILIGGQQDLERFKVLTPLREEIL